MSREIANPEIQLKRPSLWVVLAARAAELRRDDDQRTYWRILREWVGFLGMTMTGHVVLPGTVEAERCFCFATITHVEAYLRWNQTEPGIPPQTTSATERDIAEILGKADIPPEWRRANATIAKRIYVLRSLYNAAVKAGFVRQNPCSEVSVPSMKSNQKRPIHPITEEEAANMLDAADRETLCGKRDYAIMCLGFGAALRRSEVVRLKISDVRKTESGLWYLWLKDTKAGEDVRHAMPRWTAAAILFWIRERKRRGATADSPLFVGIFGIKKDIQGRKPLTDAAVNKMYKRYAKLTGLDPRLISSHTARKSSITWISQKYRNNYRKIQIFSRHKSLDMVDLYVQQVNSLESSPALDLARPRCAKEKQVH